VQSLDASLCGRRDLSPGNQLLRLSLTPEPTQPRAHVETTMASHVETTPMKKAADDTFEFPVDLSTYRKVEINPFTDTELSAQQLEDLTFNINLCRDAIVFFTACGSASGYGGHTGGAFDTVPETMMMDAFFRTCPDKFVPIFFDEAGHRVATQYLMSALDGLIDPELLRFYRKGHAKLPGHPEVGLTPGVKFSSGRLGHMWAHVNGVAMANPGKVVFCLGSDGSQMEGNDAEAARLAVAQNLNVKLILDDNDVTITGHPSNYLGGYDLVSTLGGHGLTVTACKGEDVLDLYAKVRNSVVWDGPTAVIARRPMAPGIEGAEGTSHGHDALAVPKAITYFEARGNDKAIAYLKTDTKTKDPQSEYLCCGAKAAMRGQVGQSVTEMIGKMSPEERKEKVMVIDSDLGGSTNFNKIRASHSVASLAAAAASMHLVLHTSLT
jgi:transketolase N-terminal domain/subunit